MNKTGSSDSLGTPDSRLELSSLQQAWLSEIGMDRRILAHYFAAQPSGQGVTPVANAPTPSENSATITNLAMPTTDLALAALKQAGGRRRVPVDRAGAENPPLSANTSSDRALVRRDDLPSDWTALQAHAQSCQICGLHDQRDQLVFGAGDTDQPEWFVIGEAPGKADDRTGQPFQGKAGKLLHAMLVAAGVHPSSVTLGGQPQPVPAWSHPATMYFTNVLKCRPLGNRSPDHTEASACMPYLMQQINLLQPRRILVLGRLAAQTLLETTDDIEDLRGQVHHISTAAGSKVPVVVTWHPAALLTHPQNKALAWADLHRARRL